MPAASIGARRLDVNQLHNVAAFEMIETRELRGLSRLPILSERSPMLTLVHSDAKAATTGGDVLIHVRHLNTGEVLSIDRCPPQLTAQEWRDLLLAEAGSYYQAFVGARGFFRLPRAVYDSLVANVTPMAAE
jgi:hypothetical protein